MPVLSGNESLVEKFYDANAILLSGLIRKFIEDGIEEYTRFLTSFAEKEILPFQRIIEGEKSDPLGCPAERAFLILYVTEENGKPVIVGNLQAMRESLLKVLDEIARVSTSISRPECLAGQSPKAQYLDEFPAESQELRQAMARLSPALERLFEPVESHVRGLVLPPAMNLPGALLGENPLSTAVLKGVLKTFEERAGFRAGLDSVPHYCVGRMFELDYTQLKRRGEERFAVARKEIQESLITSYKKRCNDIGRDCSQLEEILRAPIEDVDRLVFIEKFIEKTRKTTEKKIKQDYEEAYKSLQFMMKEQMRITDEEYTLLHGLSLKLLELPSLLSE